MARRTMLTYGIAGVISQDWPRRPSSVVVSVSRPDGTPLASPVSAAAATIDSVSTTLSATPTDPRTLTLASVAGVVVGGQYLVSSALDGTTETVRVVAVNGSPKTVRLEEPVQIAVASGDTFQSTRSTYALAATQQDRTARLWIADWTATYADSSKEYRRQLYDVVRSVPVCPATTAGLRRHARGLSSEFEASATRDTEGWGPYLDTAWSKIVDLVEGKGNAASTVIDWSAFETCVYEQLLLDLAEDNHCPGGNWSTDPMRWIDHRTALRDKALERALSNVAWVDENEDGKQTTSETFKNTYSCRLVR